MEDFKTLVCASKFQWALWYFIGTYRKFGHAPSECFASPGLGTQSGPIRGVHGICGGQGDTGTGKCKVKLMFTLEQATKAQRGSRGIAVLFP